MPRKRLTTEEFIIKAQAVHGDTYDYSKVEYVNADTKVKIICKTHGEFEQRASTHLEDNGCRKCVHVALTSTTEEFITKAKEIHGDTYDYSKVEYDNAKSKVNIICKTHGGFEQTPNGHINGRGCRKCGGTAKSTTEEFITKAKEIHGDTYDYSKVEYDNAKSKVKIICKTHGEFEQMPVGHLQDYGCKKCAGNVKSTTEEFIIKAQAVHGDTYDYSKVEYVNADTKVKIICKTHGEFEQVANSHLQDNGCKKCGHVALTSTTEEFIIKAQAVHGKRYDYSKVEYVNSKTKVKIICKTHGVLEKTPNGHINGDGCLDCYYVAKTSTTEEFITKAKEIHGDTYDYSKVEYVNADTKVKIICKTHGVFDQVANSHLQDNGCKKCGHVALTSTTEEFIAKAKEIHGDTYDYSLVEYVNSKTKVNIICKTHGGFEQTPDNHTSGSGCESCADYGFNPNTPAILYYLRVDSRRGLFYKIGITNRTVEERFSVDDLSIITVINTQSYEQGGDAYKKEQRVLKQFAEFRAKDVDILVNGNTELFTKDVLGLDLHLNGKGILECSPQAGG